MFEIERINQSQNSYQYAKGQSLEGWDVDFMKISQDNILILIPIIAMPHLEAQKTCKFTK